jgi:hypothetical protein
VPPTLILRIEGVAQGHHDRLTGKEFLLFGGVIQAHVEHAGGEAAVVGGIVIEVGFVRDPETDHQGDAHANGETGDIDGGIAAVLAEMAPGKEEIVLEHTFNFGIQEVCSQKMPFWLDCDNQLVGVWRGMINCSIAGTLCSVLLELLSALLFPDPFTSTGQAYPCLMVY